MLILVLTLKVTDPVDNDRKYCKCKFKKSDLIKALEYSFARFQIRNETLNDFSNYKYLIYAIITIYISLP